MNMRLLDPRDVVAGAEKAWRKGKAPLEATDEGFIRQVIGWRKMSAACTGTSCPTTSTATVLAANLPLPNFYWTAATEMNCLKDAVGQTLRYGYAHHIQRLMVMGPVRAAPGVKPRTCMPVSGRRCGCRRMGGTAEHARHEPICRRRRDGVEAVLRVPAPTSTA